MSENLGNSPKAWESENYKIFEISQKTGHLGNFPNS